jgi:hypothetical protein
MTTRVLKEDDYAKLIVFAMAGQQNGSKYPGMSYEDGMMAVIDVIDENVTADEATE